MVFDNLGTSSLFFNILLPSNLLLAFIEIVIGFECQPVGSPSFLTGPFHISCLPPLTSRLVLQRIPIALDPLLTLPWINSFHEAGIVCLFSQ